MPLAPSRRDNTGPPSRNPRDATDLSALIRHHGSYLRSIDPGILGGRWATPRPVPNRPSGLVGDDGAGGDSDTVVGEDGDRHVCFGAGIQRFQLSYLPIEETVHLFWHASANSAGNKWENEEHYEVDYNTGIITIYPFTRAGQTWPRPGHVFSAQYLHLLGEDDVAEPEILVGSFEVSTFAVDRTIETGLTLVTGQEYRIVVSGNYCVDGPVPELDEFPACGGWDMGRTNKHPQADAVAVYFRAVSEVDQWVGLWGNNNPFGFRLSASDPWQAWAYVRSENFWFSGGWAAGDPCGFSSDIFVGTGGELQFQFTDAFIGDNNGSLLMDVYEA